MSENSIPEERTEMPTERRMGQLRKEGAIHFSTEVVQVLSLIMGFYALSLMWGYLVDDMKLTMIKSFNLIGTNEELTPQVLYSGFFSLVALIAPHIIVIVLMVASVAVLAQMLQTKWNVKDRKIDFKLFHINPIQGLKRIFSINGIITTLKALFKLSIILPIGYMALKGFAPQMIMLIHLNIEEVMAFTGIGIAKLFWQIMTVLIIFAIFDYFWGRRQWFRQNKMTKPEVKDERKSVEGDEETRRRIQQKGFQRILQRIRENVPKADVVVTNPTHYAIALRYDRETMNAPVVVAKGKDFLAQKIREIAREHDVPVLERKALARALFDSCEVGSRIPYELFRAVAEVLAYVYRLKNKFIGAGAP